MFCPNCGTQIPDGSAFCENCGADLSAAAQGVPAQEQGPAQSPQASWQDPSQQPSYPQPSYPQPSYQQASQQQSADQQSSYQQSSYQQAPAQPAYGQDDGTHRMSVRTASLLCYWFSFIGWGLSFLLADNRDPYLRFHLNQSLILWIAQAVCHFLFDSLLARSMLSLVASGLIFVIWIIAFVGSCKGETKSAPLIGMIPPILK